MKPLNRNKKPACCERSAVGVLLHQLVSV